MVVWTIRIQLWNGLLLRGTPKGPQTTGPQTTNFPSWKSPADGLLENDPNSFWGWFRPILSRWFSCLPVFFGGSHVRKSFPKEGYQPLVVKRSAAIHASPNVIRLPQAFASPSWTVPYRSVKTPAPAPWHEKHPQIVGWWWVLGWVGKPTPPRKGRGFCCFSIGKINLQPFFFWRKEISFEFQEVILFFRETFWCLGVFGGT